MDPAVAQMMADLGLARRDLVSAPEADARGRLVRENLREQTAILAGVEARRAQTLASGSVGGERGARLKAWNTETTFERDSVTDQLTNRFSGQGHRAALTANHDFDRRREEAENRYGEERWLYLQDKEARSGGNYVATPGSKTAQHRPRDNLPAGVNRTIPRSFASGNGGNRTPDRGRVASAPNPNRAPSPRSFGTVRFATRGPNRAPSPRSFGTVRFPPRGRRIDPAASASRTVAPTTPAQVRPSAAKSATSNSAAPTGTANAMDATHSLVEQESAMQWADWYAANPGPEADEYHANHPDRKRYLRPAWVRLVKKAFFDAKDPHGRDVADYLATHKDREWLFAAAMNAKHFVENRTEAEMDDYYNAHPDHLDFCKAAKKYFKPKLNNAISQSEPTTQAESATQSEATTQPEPTIQPESTTQPEPTAQPEPSTSTPTVQPPPTVIEPVTNGERSTIPAAVIEQQDSSPPKSPSERSVETAAFEPGPTALGTLSAMFWDIAGEFLSVNHMNTNVPAQVHINITSRAQRFNLRDLIPQIEALADQMQNLSSGSVEHSTEHGLEGVTVTDDGLWEEV